MVPRSGIRNPGSGKNLSRIQGSKRHRIPDPDPQHWLKSIFLELAGPQYSNPDSKRLFRFRIGSGQKFRILPDPQHWKKVN
jgi:hypothetical protein